MGSVVQMGENSILFFENIFGLSPGIAVVWVPIHWVGSTEVFDLGNAQLPVASLLIEQPWLHVARVDVVRPSDDIMVHAWSVIKTFRNA